MDVTYVVVDLDRVPMQLLHQLRDLHMCPLYLVLNPEVAEYARKTPAMLDGLGTIIVEGGSGTRFQCLVDVCDRHNLTNIMYIDSCNRIHGNVHDVLQRLSKAKIDARWVSIPGFIFFPDAAATRLFVSTVGVADVPAKATPRDGILRLLKGLYVRVRRWLW